MNKVWQVLCLLLCLFGIVRGAEAATNYTIAWGDTLTAISKNHGPSIEAIMQANVGNRAIKNRDLIYAERTIVIPDKGVAIVEKEMASLGTLTNLPETSRVTESKSGKYTHGTFLWQNPNLEHCAGCDLDYFLVANLPHDAALLLRAMVSEEQSTPTTVRIGERFTAMLSGNNVVRHNVVAAWNTPLHADQYTVTVHGAPYTIIHIGVGKHWAVREPDIVWVDETPSSAVRESNTDSIYIIPDGSSVSTRSFATEPIYSYPPQGP